MNPERLLQHFDTISDAPDAVARLRRLILDLAVRGKLVEQEAGDGPASELLKRIAKEKAQLVKMGDLRKPRELCDGRAIEDPFAIPSTWRWVRLDAIGAIIGGGTPSSTEPTNFAEPGEGNAWLTPADLGGYAGLYISRGARDLSEKGSRSSSATVMPAGTVLFTSRAPIGYVAIAANPISTNQGFKSIVPYVADCSRFIATAMKAFAPEIDAKAPGTTFKEVSGKIVAAIPIPLPPLEEQHRIVAKVDELMALCDQLQAARDVREQQRDRLVAASLHRLTVHDAADSDDGAELGARRTENTRFHLQQLSRLSTRHEHIKQLRQTILNLAVRGRLVPQDNIDVSVAEQLERLNALTTVSISKKARARADVTRIESEVDSAAELPIGWHYIPLGDVCPLITSGSRGWAEFYSQSGPEFIRAQNIRFGVLNLGDLAHVNPPKRAEGARTLVAKGDLLMVITGAGVTNAGLVEHEIEEAYVSQHVALIRPADSKLSRWLLLCLMAPDASRSELVERAYGSGKPGLNLENIRTLRLPLPPLSEQHRIVGKVDELMALCDQLEASLATIQADQRRLLDVLLQEALSEAA